MAQKADKAGEVLASRKNELTVVAQDRNWRSYVQRELRDADVWNQDWGFLSSKANGKFKLIHHTSPFTSLCKVAVSYDKAPIFSRNYLLLILFDMLCMQLTNHRT